MPKKKQTQAGKPSVRRRPATPASRYAVTIDHPVDGERIVYTGHYAVRIGTPNEGVVQLSLDGGEYRSCRFGGGYWWYDWHGIPAGQHTLVARLVDPLSNRVLRKSSPVTVTVG